MRAGIAALIAGYVLSQFYRAFLAVLTGDLARDIGADPGDLAISSGLWFLAFALMQIPVGEALDRVGPRLTTAVLLTVAAAGAAVFAMADSAGDVHLAMILIGAGCSPVLMASYFIFARIYSPAVFGTLAGAVVGAGSLGNILGAAPLAALVAATGWRAALTGLAVVTLGVAAVILAFVRDPARAERPAGGNGSLLDILRLPGFWTILPLMFVAYAPAAAIRGLWAGPYLRDVYGMDAAGVGRATLVMGLAMVAGNFAYGPLDRLVGSKKWGVCAGVGLAVGTLFVLAILPARGVAVSVALLAAAGFFGASFPAIMAHGRAFFPAHLVGRGVTFLNMFGIGGAGVLQFLSGRAFVQPATPADAAASYAGLFVFFLVPLLAGLAVYLFSRDPTPA